MWYVFDGHKNIADKDNLPYMKDETYIFDNIEVYCLLGSADTDHPLFVDKNHDLSYYVKGSDYVDSSNYDTSPGTYGYEWGGYGTETGITAAAIGTGLDNTNNLIQRELSPSTSGWYVVWDKIKEFREAHSDKWFLPSKDELKLIYRAKSNLSNLSTSTRPFYWSSSESYSSTAWVQYFDAGNQGSIFKDSHGIRSRLCYTL